MLLREQLFSLPFSGHDSPICQSYIVVGLPFQLKHAQNSLSLAQGAPVTALHVGFPK